nr:COMT protein [Stephania japonica]
MGEVVGAERVQPLDEESLQGQAEVWSIFLSFAETMAPGCALELRIPDIINSHGRPITLPEILKSINYSPSSPQTPRVSPASCACSSADVSHRHVTRGRVQYGLTRASKWLLREAKLSLAPFALLETHPVMMTPWHYLSRSVEVGGEPFEMAYGTNCCDYAFVDREYDKIFNAGMECTAKIVMKMVLNGYKSGFDGLGTVVEVGGGTGMFIREIVMANPGLKGVLLNVPHVVASAPDHPDVVKIGGDMFVEVPQGDAVVMRWVLHDWPDENAIKPLKNCRKAIPESGKVVIVDAVVHPEKEGLFEFTRVVFDLVVMAHTSGGKERTEEEWNHILHASGFPRYNIIKTPNSSFHYRSLSQLISSDLGLINFMLYFI